MFAKANNKQKREIVEETDKAAAENADGSETRQTCEIAAGKQECKADELNFARK